VTGNTLEEKLNLGGGGKGLATDSIVLRNREEGTRIALRSLFAEGGVLRKGSYEKLRLAQGIYLPINT